MLIRRFSSGWSLLTATHEWKRPPPWVRSSATFAPSWLILNLWYHDLQPNTSDPKVIAKLDMAQAFQTMCRALTLDVFSGKASRDYACGFKQGDTIPPPVELSRFLGYVYSMRSVVGKERYHDSNGHVHVVESKTGGLTWRPLRNDCLFRQCPPDLWQHSQGFRRGRGSLCR